MKGIFYILFLLPLFLIGQFEQSNLEIGNTDIKSIQAGNTTVWTKASTGPDLTDLLAYYNFESDYTDSYGSYNGTGAFVGTGSAPSFTTGKVSNAVVTVQGTNAEYVTIADNDVFSFTDGAGNDEAFTISTWVYSPSGDNRGFFVNRRTSGGGTVAEYQFVNDNGSWMLALFDSTSGSIYIGQKFTYTMPTSTWVHFAATYDGSETDAGIKLYKNGVLQTMTTNSSGSYTGMANTTMLTYIGAFGQIPNSATTGFDGRIDLLQVWNRELTATEILDNYNLENAGTLITD